MTKPDLLFIAHRIPYPPDKGDKIRSYHMLRYLAPHYRITVACIIDDPAEVRYVEPLKKMVHRVFYEVRTSLEMKIRALSSLFTNSPFTLPCFYSKVLQKSVDNYLTTYKPCAILCICSSSTEYIFRSRNGWEFLKDRILLTDLIDVDSEKWHDYSTKYTGLKKWLYQREARLLLPYEQQIISTFDRTFLVSEEERNILAQHGPVEKVESLPNGVDLEYFSPLATFARLNHSTSIRLIFSGAMDYWPNIEGAVWFVKEIFPKVKKVFPEAVFCIAGRNPDAAVVALKKKPGVEVTGSVPDMRTYLAAANLCVVPLKIARGIQNKVLEGMSMEKPVIATPGAATGLKAEPGKEIIVAENASEMASAIIELLGDIDKQRTLGVNARKYVEREHSWATHLSRLIELIEKGN